MSSKTPNFSAIVATTTALGQEAFKNEKIWCGNRYGRKCHEANNTFGSKCKNCGQYCHDEYTAQHKAYYEKAFAGNDKTYVILEGEN